MTGHAGLPLTGELAARTGLVARPDGAIEAVHPFSNDGEAATPGELLVALAEMMAVGGVASELRSGDFIEYRRRSTCTQRLPIGQSWP